MMVSLRQTSLKYRGRKASTYDAIRVKQARWDLENEVVERWLDELRPASILDCPFGTGRFVKFYEKLRTEFVTGVDISEEMLALARKKLPKRAPCAFELTKGSAEKIDAADKKYDVVICVRFLDLIDEDAMQTVLKEMCRVALRSVLLTIRLGDRYVPKSNTAEHDRKKFLALVSRLGFRVKETVLFREGDWNIIRLERK